MAGAINEHFDGRWRPLPEFNADAKVDQFRPYGYMPGHSFEWARLLIQLAHALGDDAPEWLLEAAERLWSTALRHGWEPDGFPGIPYTLDWSDRPVVDRRLWWVHAEAAGAARALRLATGRPIYDEWSRRLWAYIGQYVVDEANGSWRHEQAPDGRPSVEVFAGRPDTYHALQATLLEQLQICSSLPGALR